MGVPVHIREADVDRAFWKVKKPNWDIWNQGSDPTPSPGSAAVIVLAATLGLATLGWVISAKQMDGMDMGAATRLGSFASFAIVWVAMMAAMMLPGATPAVHRARLSGRVRNVPLFVGSYLAIWALVGVAVYGLYRPHGPVATGAVVTAAGAYELTPFKRHFRRRCRESAGSGLRFGIYCAASSIGLMAMLVALGVMSLTWMTMTAILVTVQKLLPAHIALDLPLALAMTGFGVWIMMAASSVPGFITPI